MRIDFRSGYNTSSTEGDILMVADKLIEFELKNPDYLTLNNGKHLRLEITYNNNKYIVSPANVVLLKSEKILRITGKVRTLSIV